MVCSNSLCPTCGNDIPKYGLLAIQSAPAALETWSNIQLLICRLLLASFSIELPTKADPLEEEIQLHKKENDGRQTGLASLTA